MGRVVCSSAAEKIVAGYVPLHGISCIVVNLEVGVMFHCTFVPMYHKLYKMHIYIYIYITHAHTIDHIYRYMTHHVYIFIDTDGSFKCIDIFQDSCPDKKVVSFGHQRTFFCSHYYVPAFDRQ